jgi:LysM domain-containing protein
MANIINNLTSISPSLRSGSSPGRRLLAMILAAMLAFGSLLPGAAAATEADTEGEGAAAPVEAPAPDFDPGGEETALEEVPAAGITEEGGAVEVEPESEAEVPTASEVTSAVAEGDAGEGQTEPVEVPPLAPAPEAETTPQKAETTVTSEPVANQSIAAPSQPSSDRHARGDHEASSTGTSPPAEPSLDETPAAPPPSPSPRPDAEPARHLAGDEYVVQDGDCLWHLAEALLPADATELEIKLKVKQLWRLNKDRIGTGDPNVILPGTRLLLP